MNLEDSQAECLGGSICNLTEAKFVASLARAVRNEVSGKYSVGILTFYNKQRAKIRESLRELRVPVFDERHQNQNAKDAVSIRSVDSFQVTFMTSILEQNLHKNDFLKKMVL